MNNAHRIAATWIACGVAMRFHSPLLWVMWGATCAWAMWPELVRTSAALRSIWCERPRTSEDAAREKREREMWGVEKR